jgi:hypothetical protein
LGAAERAKGGEDAELGHDGLLSDLVRAEMTAMRRMGWDCAPRETRRERDGGGTVSAETALRPSLLLYP